VIDRRSLAARTDFSRRGFLDEDEEEMLLRNLEHAIGFMPTFHLINSTVGLIESVIPMGKNNGLAASVQWQMNSILMTLDSALHIISATFPSDTTKLFKYPVVVFDAFEQV
jgi:hypothetical protein